MFGDVFQIGCGLMSVVASVSREADAGIEPMGIVSARSDRPSVDDITAARSLSWRDSVN